MAHLAHPKIILLPQTAYLQQTSTNPPKSYTFKSQYLSPLSYPKIPAILFNYSLMAHSFYTPRFVSYT
jgi:hypothetical protein